MKKSLVTLVLLLLCNETHAMKNVTRNTSSSKDEIPTTSKDEVKQKEDGKNHLLKSKAITFPQVHFSPGIQDVLINFINNEQQGMQGAWYRFTLYKVAQAIAKGTNDRKIKASLIVNDDYKNDFCTPLRLIIKNGGTVYSKTMPRNGNNQGKFEIMHHKFMIFTENVGKKKLVWTGSWNATGQADLKNCENAVILDDDQSIKKFEHEFDEVISCSNKINADECISKKDTEANSKFARTTMNSIPEPKS